MEQIQATGRRKSAISRVYLKRGNGNISVNGKAYQEYFRVNHIQGKIIEPLKEVGVENLYDIKVNVKYDSFNNFKEFVANKGFSGVNLKSIVFMILDCNRNVSISI